MNMAPLQSQQPLSAADRLRLQVSLQQAGMSVLGSQQALQGSIVSDVADRAAIARILAGFASLPSHARTEIYDYPGTYAPVFDGVETPRRKE
jgi:hypothetical protein